MSVEAVADPETALPGENPDEQPEPELFVEGTGQISMLPGGEEAVGSEMILQGGSIAVDGEFAKGEFIDLSVRVRVAEVAFADKYGGDEVVDTVRRHKAKIVRLERVG